MNTNVNPVSPPQAPNVELPFHEYVRRAFAGGHGDVEVFPEPGRLAKLPFAIHGEGPLVLADDTILRRCKQGVLLTTHAIYVLGDGRRLDLSLVKGGPNFPAGEDKDGYIETTQGDFPVPWFVQPFVREALERIVAVVAAWGRGERSGPPDPLAVFAARGPISQAAVQLLLGAEDVLAPWKLSERKRRGLRIFSRGMDHLGGEEVLAVVDETTLGACDEGVVLTDRALRYRNEKTNAPNDLYTVPYAHLSAVTAKGSVFGRSLLLATSIGPRELQLTAHPKAVENIQRFLGAVLQLPPHARGEARPAGPPIGDPKMLAHLDALGLPPALAADFRTRIFLQHQNELWGRGGNLPWALSPLSLDDLKTALPFVLGPPTLDHWDGQVATLDFSLRPDTGSRAGAIASSVVGVALLATVGIGWITVPKGPKITAIRVRVYPVPGGTSLRVTGIAGGAELEAPVIADTVDSGLLLVEQELLRRRCLMGPDVPPQVLMGLDDAALANRAHELASLPR